MLTPTRRTRSQSVSAASQKPRLFRRNSSLHDLEDVVYDLRTKVSTREEEIAEVRRWLTEAETEAEGLKERLERVEAEREEAMLEIDELRRRADRVIDNDMPSRISVDTTLRSRRTSSALSSATTAVQSPGSPKYLSLAAKKSLEVGESAVVDKASLVYLQRMSTQMLCCFFFV
ncbi:hypothetical protein BC829DRAFT_207314 [Chytridium lagenaria]|nr:hypothetical protein BC829DRAFT_207314 [Chytridium lagenaria]